jgi:hypothetical protein
MRVSWMWLMIFNNTIFLLSTSLYQENQSAYFGCKTNMI